MSLLESVYLVSVYLTSKCNFDCSYCDRAFVRTKNVPVMQYTDSIPQTVKQFPNARKVSFHGGEPLLHVDTIAKVIDALGSDYTYTITTNGSLILRHPEFFVKYRKQLRITISYDLEFQEDNRSYIDLPAIKSYLFSQGIPVMLQCVLPNSPVIATPEFFHRNLPAISGCSVNLIPLRHHRGKEKFVDFFDGNSPLPNFVPLVNALYNYNIPVIVDGCYEAINKDYQGAHNKVILSPDGLLYTEYDFLEYKITKQSVGTWYPQFELHSNEEAIPEHCVGCSQRANCGIKFLYEEFGVAPNTPHCHSFYKDCSKLINYTIGLRQQPSFYNHLQPKQDDFVSKDGLRSLKELSFSLLDRYDCWAGCKICYVRDHIGNAIQAPKTIPDYSHILSCYNKVTVSDDLYALRSNAPHLFDWYVQNQQHFWFGSFTDNALFRSLPLYGSDLRNSKGLHEITISEEFAAKTQAKLLPLLLDYSPRIIKYIGTRVPDWLAKYAIDCGANLHYQPNIRMDRDSFGNTSYVSLNGELHNRLSESDFLQGSNFHLTTMDSIRGQDAYDTVEDFNPVTHLYKHLNAKLSRYSKFLHPYFVLAVKNYMANEDFNYVPTNLLNNDFGFYYSLLKEGWVSTELGLLSPNIVDDKVIPLCSPRQYNFIAQK